jgi:Bacterial regulatory proteins, gntR family
MSNPTTLVLRVTATLSAIGLVVASAGFGAVFAYRVGEQFHWTLAVLTVLMALALEGIKPVAVAGAFQSFSSWQIFRGLALSTLGLLAVAYSLTSELSLISMSRGDLAAQRQQAIDQGENAKSKIELAKRELANLRPARPSQVVAEGIRGIESLPGIMINGSPCGGTYNGKVTKLNCPKLAALRAELGRAQRREELQAVIFNPDSKPDGSGVKVADPGSHALAIYLAALGFNVSSNLVAQWIYLIPVLALELGSAFAVVLVQTVGHHHPSAKNPDEIEVVHGPAVQIETEQQGGSTSVVPKLTNSKAGPIDRKTIEARVLSHVLAHDGEWLGSERELAKHLGTTKSTVRRALAALSEAGKLRIEPSKSGTALSCV